MKACFCKKAAALLLLGLFVSCSPKSQDSEEIRALREEVKSLREELSRQKSIPPLVASQAEVVQDTGAAFPEFAEFLRVSRRMVSAVSIGVDFADFGLRLVDINALSEEVLQKMPTQDKRQKIGDFVVALNDAHSLWRYKINSPRDRLRLVISNDAYFIDRSAVELGPRWHQKFAELVKKYELRDEKNVSSPIKDYDGRTEMHLGRALERIFNYATTTFREIENAER